MGLKTTDYQSLLDKADQDVSRMPVICGPPEQICEGDLRYPILDIIGEESDLGVENLRGSGLIAGETARAYDEIFTLTLVVGRTVGIGAYLVRLGQRTVQKTRNSPIILTGYQALNKLMGREIYTTNDQLGGPMIMFPNGVSHQLAETHLDAVHKSLAWLAFVPAAKGLPLPVLDMTGLDIPERAVTVAPIKGMSYDPRLLLCGSGHGAAWKPGFLDRDTFIEALGGWAKTVVVGRGRLGGLPIGIIVTENRTAEATKPADPADATSHEKMVQQAGGVWFPDSAYKTAQALRDFSREGLPCIVFANWRGFSGGQRDMFDEVLKFGSMIVDALVAYQQPLFVYIPPFAELRGGAWVVVDSTINADVMEFYAAEDARGGVLEAAGAASIKFRDRDILAAARRLDPTLIQIYQAMQVAQIAGNATEVAVQQRAAKQRERLLFGVYQQVAVHFADLHDTPGRMHAKGVIRQQVQWSDSRRFFYWRLRRKLLEFSIASEVSSNSSSLKSENRDGYLRRPPTATKQTNQGMKNKTVARKEVFNQLQVWVTTEAGSDTWMNDKSFVEWLEAPQQKSSLSYFLQEKKKEAVAARLADDLSDVLGFDSEEDSVTILKKTFEKLTPMVRQKAVEAMRSLVE
jgi:acetyl-CoA carboxylase/biotin carboxylase 1